MIDGNVFCYELTKRIDKCDPYLCNTNKNFLEILDNNILYFLYGYGFQTFIIEDINTYIIFSYVK